MVAEEAMTSDPSSVCCGGSRCKLNGPGLWACCCAQTDWASWASWAGCSSREIKSSWGPWLAAEWLDAMVWTWDEGEDGGGGC